MYFNHFNRGFLNRSRNSCDVEKKTGTLTLFMMKIIFDNIDVIDSIVKTSGVF